ncbi:hypothetical protein Barb6XT_00782 [Bacteroidales bacterium Barb6XT]|nr:hypothetical protein Barb6XT_00782 [Bacteroidales bacterium Barb6XT]
MFEINNATPIAALTVGQFTELLIGTCLREKEAAAKPSIIGKGECCELTGYNQHPQQIHL